MEKYYDVAYSKYQKEQAACNRWTGWVDWTTGLDYCTDTRMHMHTPAVRAPSRAPVARICMYAYQMYVYKMLIIYSLQAY